MQSGATAKNTGLEIMMSETESETEEMNNTHFEDANETLNEEINRSLFGTDDEAREETKFARTRSINSTRKNPYVNTNSNYSQQNNQFQNEESGNFNSNGRNGNQCVQCNKNIGGCFICGSTNHWKRDCNQKQINTFGQNGGRQNHHDDDTPFIRMRHSNK